MIKIAENKLTKTPNAKVSAKPLIKEVENINKMTHTSKELILLSLIDGQARLNPSEIANGNALPCRISSFILAKIKILASTAIPMDKINPPMPAKVNVTGTSLNMESVMATYIIKAMEANRPGNR